MPEMLWEQTAQGQRTGILPSWMTACGAIGVTRAISPVLEEPSEAQQELEEARRELEEKQQQRDEAFREAERENAALPEEEEKQKKPAGSKAADAAPTELVLPQREARTGSPVRYILIGALLAGALCIAIYLFTHPAREDDPADETKP